MELRQLRYLLALADEGSFTRAAARANIAQPALSRQIQKLEAELGLPLVDRTSRRMRLTPAGSEVVAAGRRALGDLDLLRDALQATISLLRGTVSIGVTQTPGPLDVPRALAAFHRRHPDVELVVREGLSHELADQLRKDHIDLALVSGISVPQRRQLTLERCRVEDLAVLLPAAHPLATRKRLRIADLREERFVSFPPGATIRETVERAAADAGFVPHASLEIGEVSRTAALVAEGLGIAVLPASDARRAGPRTVTIPLRAPTLRYEVSIAWRALRAPSPAARALRTLILEGAQEA